MKWSERNKFIGFFTSDWQKKLVSLIVAAVLWYWVNFPEYEELTFSSTIAYKNLPKDYEIIETYDPVVHVKVRGLKEKIKNLDFDKMVHFIVNLEKAAPGVNYYMLEIQLSEPQPDIIFTPMLDRVKLRIDKMESKVVMIQPLTTGNPGEGYVLDDILLPADRRMTTITGPASVLTQYNYIETVPLSIEGATNDITQTVPLNLPNLVKADGPGNLVITARIVKKTQDPGTGVK
ncbi:MAG: YbbR-like domain-containing protein [Brevinematales bacterium]|jgi:YbbR domain-containing protein